MVAIWLNPIPPHLLLSNDFFLGMSMAMGIFSAYVQELYVRRDFDINSFGVNATESPATPAAQYVRMSTEHQQYSTSNQEDVIREFALRRGYRIVKTYADEGRSGLTAAA